MYSQQSANMASQKPETFMLSAEAQKALPDDAQQALQEVDRLKFFLMTAPVDWDHRQYIRRCLLPTGEYVSCVLWNTLFHITGTDIVRCLSFRFQAFGRPVKNSKKFEEGIFSDLRNLKSGTDASLEEPKSPFLDFLYKNNCIRTQKKQKVFYWYSVPHDRLFLDALERDLKREKMGQEATTVAVSEPALSFQYDSSQSLYEQLTKAQQAASSSLAAQQPSSFAQSQSTSPVVREVDSMPPPQMIPQSMPQSMPQSIPQSMPLQSMPPPMSMTPQSMHPLGDGMDAMVSYETMAMSQAMPPQQMVKRETDYGRIQYTQSGIPVTAGHHQRHASMPAYTLEYSPAPSFVSSQFEDYSNRGMSFEPITPPQQSMGLAAEPAYIANEETGLYTAIPDHLGAGMNALNGLILPPSNFAAPQFSRGYGPANVYSVYEGSPTYKQRRRRSSIPPTMAGVPVAGGQTQAAPYRPSDLRRSVSASVGPVAECEEHGENSPPGLSYSTATSARCHEQHKDVVDLSRHGTPLSNMEGSPSMNPMPIQQHEYAPLTADSMAGEGAMAAAPRSVMQAPSGAVRHRSTSVMEVGPYPQKSHTCPIPTCGRLFKRVEHLKRYVHQFTHINSSGITVF
ncbi:STE-domain-containing protein [Sodiomyces alkalinus F11]|uniref:STE-domain-containing protein n=1 Tax=Sodiomyces alkalinus (strain CBS 110278 / VKM F-3762 / F11) TaxID=1314773 RepID=A0A3N2PV15_SODAK|nr:STE-domain-containing protein [Sodiomyces alkalinus F11]ROT38341.1 STE-domain-containing protein [Sodiomyces alkalinus F11]